MVFLNLLAVVRDKQNMSSHSLSPLLRLKKPKNFYCSLCLIFEARKLQRHLNMKKKSRFYVGLLGGKKFSAMGIESFVSK